MIISNARDPALPLPSSHANVFQMYFMVWRITEWGITAAESVPASTDLWNISTYIEVDLPVINFLSVLFTM